MPLSLTQRHHLQVLLTPRLAGWPGEALPVLARRYGKGCADGGRIAAERGCSFTLAVGEASQFSPIVIGGT